MNASKKVLALAQDMLGEDIKIITSEVRLVEKGAAVRMKVIYNNKPRLVDFVIINLGNALDDSPSNLEASPG